MASKITIVSNQCFSCLCCGQCCRPWYVPVSEHEITTLRNLDWQDDLEVPADPFVTIHGHTYLAHNLAGTCVFLDTKANLCRLHHRFGAATKPLGCRVYPLNIASIYSGEVSVSARLDCPAVQRNAGPPLTQNRRQIEDYVRLIGVRGGFSSEQLEDLNPAAISLMTRGLFERVVAWSGATPAQKSLALLMTVENLQMLSTPFLNDMATLAEVLPTVVKTATDKAAGTPASPMGMFSRAVFREWLAAYLRRDEDMVVKGAKARWQRTLTLGLILAGHGSFKRLGDEHPDLPLGRVHMFPGASAKHADANPTSAVTTASADTTWECYWRMLGAHLETLQFFGVCYYGLPFFSGLRALIQTYPLVLAAARYHATARNAAGIAAEDVQYAVGAIDHSWGRSRLLQMQMWRTIENYFSGERYPRLLAALGE